MSFYNWFSDIFTHKHRTTKIWVNLAYTGSTYGWVCIQYRHVVGGIHIAHLNGAQNAYERCMYAACTLHHAIVHRACSVHFSNAPYTIVHAFLARCCIVARCCTERCMHDASRKNTAHQKPPVLLTIAKKMLEIKNVGNRWYDGCVWWPRLYFGSLGWYVFPSNIFSSLLGLSVYLCKRIPSYFYS